jgi:predicted phage baseplate assembly protein
VGGGRIGNVAASTVFVPVATQIIQRATNPQAAAGGADQEGFDRARSFAPRLYRTQDRAVTMSDYVDLALQVAGVGKARAITTAWNDVLIYIAPSGEVADPSELLTRDVLAYLESKRMATTRLKILGPQPADIYLGAIIRAQPYFLQSDVRAAVEAAVAAYLAFDAVDFGQPIFLSRVYDVIQNLPQVASLTVFKFSQTPDLPANIVPVPDVDPDGIIELNPFELPRPGYRDNPDTPPKPAGPYPSGLALRPPIYTIIEGGVFG